jgi:hypothetical protein
MILVGIPHDLGDEKRCIHHQAVHRASPGCSVFPRKPLPVIDFKPWP